MKRLLQTFNWKNFVQRALLFLAVFLVVRFLVDWIENDISFERIFQQSMIRYLVFAMILGFLDSETWKTRQQENDEPLQFSSNRAAFIHYSGMAFFIALLCGLILLIFGFIGWAIGMISGKQNPTLFSDWIKYILVVAVIGICFSAYDALRNYRRNRKGS